MASDWRPAKSLDTLLAQVNKLVPNRDKSSDGTLGDAAHAATQSDHNPDENGIVHARDITHDPRHGVDTYALAEYLRTKRDSRIKYVISNGRIFGDEAYAKRNGVKAWTWGKYSGKNKHDQHVHVSVNTANGDDARPWDISLGGVAPPPDTKPPVTPPTPDGQPELKKGDRGAAVEKLQHLLYVDGIFGAKTKVAVQAFQRANGLTADGIVGPETWAKLIEKIQIVPNPPIPLVPPLESLPPATDEKVFRGITASVFGGASDPNRSAYTDKMLDDTSPYVALPWRFKGTRPRVQVTNPRNGQSAVATIEDVGPWMIDDDYWASGSRPVAEVCRLTRTPLPSGPNKGKIPTNPAGIDLSPALAKKLGIDGLGKVDWQFV